MALSQRVVVGSVVDVYRKRTVGEKNVSVVNFKMAISKRVRDPQTDEWGDGEPEFLSVTAWGRLADNVVTSFNKGDKVFAVGDYFFAKPRKNEKTGEMYPAEGKLVATAAGHEISFIAAHSEREAKNPTSAQSEGGDAPSQASVPRRTKTEAAPAADAPKGGNTDLFADSGFDSDSSGSQEEWDF
jgi:single-strand DNA-binding protein